MNLLIKGEATGLKYCSKHNEWSYFDDENNCCQRERNERGKLNGR